MSCPADDVTLELVGELDEPDMRYAFNMMEVVRHKATGLLFYATDVGCSCPSPFEDCYFRGPEDTNLTPITAGDSFISFQREVDEFPDDLQNRQELLSAVRRHLGL